MSTGLLLAVIVITLLVPARLARNARPKQGLRRMLLWYAGATALWAFLIARYYVVLALKP